MNNPINIIVHSILLISCVGIRLIIHVIQSQTTNAILYGLCKKVIICTNGNNKNYIGVKHSLMSFIIIYFFLSINVLNVL